MNKNSKKNSNKTSKKNSNKTSKKNSNKTKKSIKKSNKKQFFFNPDNPKLSYDVYIDKNPSDTISIKYIIRMKMVILKMFNFYKDK